MCVTFSEEPLWAARRQAIGALAPKDFRGRWSRFLFFFSTTFLNLCDAVAFASDGRCGGPASASASSDLVVRSSKHRKQAYDSGADSCTAARGPGARPLRGRGGRPRPTWRARRTRPRRTLSIQSPRRKEPKLGNFLHSRGTGVDASMVGSYRGSRTILRYSASHRRAPGVPSSIRRSMADSMSMGGVVYGCGASASARRLRCSK